MGVLLPLPVVSPENVGAFNEVNNELGETYGWDQLVDQIEVVFLGLTPEERSTAVIYTSNYGEAGAIEVIGSDRLPPPISGHNNYWLWGPGDRQGPIIGVGHVQSHLKLVCPQVTAVSMITNEAGIDNEENGATIWLCLNPDAPLSSAWDEVRHFDRRAAFPRSDSIRVGQLPRRTHRSCPHLQRSSRLYRPLKSRGCGLSSSRFSGFQISRRSSPKAKPRRSL